MVLLQLQDRSNINEKFFKLIQTKYRNDSIATEYLHNVSSVDSRLRRRLARRSHLGERRPHRLRSKMALRFTLTRAYLLI